MSWSRYLPEAVRDRPGRQIEVWVEPAAGTAVPSDVAQRMQQALRSAGITGTEQTRLTWGLEIDWHTVVLGAVRRPVREQAELRVSTARPGHPCLVLSCEPLQTHDAHAAGAAAVVVLAVAAWLLGGWSTVGVPIGMTTLLAGATLVALTRRLALLSLEARLTRLASDLVEALWPLEGPVGIELGSADRVP
jgi:hypothetical protein